MIIPQTIKERGSVFGVDSGYTFKDQILWKLVIKFPKPDYLLERPATRGTLVQSITLAIENNLPLLTRTQSKSETAPTSGKIVCTVCRGTYVHEYKCPNHEQPLRRFL